MDPWQLETRMLNNASLFMDKWQITQHFESIASQIMWTTVASYSTIASKENVSRL